MTDEMRELLNNSYKGTYVIKYIEKLEKENNELKILYNNVYADRKNLELKLESLEKKLVQWLIF